MISTDIYSRCVVPLPGGGNLVQVWILKVHGNPDDDSHHAVPSCIVTDVERAINGSLFSGGADCDLRDDQVKNWNDVPTEVQDELTKSLSDDINIIGENES